MATDRQKECWRRLASHQQRLAGLKTGMMGLFGQDPQRQQRFSLALDGLLFDYSKNLLDEQSLSGLLELARASNLESAIARLFAGEPVNTTEDRPALHMALRGHKPAAVPEAPAQVAACLQQMEDFAGAIQHGNWRGCSGETITDVVNLGIGGSDLGPAMVVEALRPFRNPALRCHFVSNVDPEHLHRTLTGLQPARTLFIVASKSFTTLETRENAESARSWYLNGGGSRESLSRHFVAVSNNVQAAMDFGIDSNNIFPMQDWVGGRYSLWSAVGLVIALATGMKEFRQLLAGAELADRHFRQAPLAENIPVIMGLLTLWYSNLWQAQTHAVLPYWQNLHLLPAFLQQLEMESLGKRIGLDGSAVGTDTGTILWGGTGTNAQHSFHQLLHQGTRLVPVDFIAVAQAQEAATARQHALLLANCFSQSQALMIGRSLEQVKAEMQAQGMSADRIAALAPHRYIPGNRPSNTLLLNRFDPHSLGMLIALYEHRVYVQSVVLGINAFDQWGVELGKQLSPALFGLLNGEDGTGVTLDPSTRALIDHSLKTRKQQQEST